MDTRQCLPCRVNIKMYCTLILLIMQIIRTSSGHGRSANLNLKPHFGTNLDTLSTSLRRDIASISVTEVNRSRNLRQTQNFDNESYRIFNELNVPKHPQRQYHSDFDNSVERNSSDNRKPAFYACKDYAPKVKEEQPWNTFVIKVEAEDPDEYDTITYSFEKSANERGKFRINDKTGEIVTSYVFDRDEPIREKEVSYQ